MGLGDLDQQQCADADQIDHRHHRIGDRRRDGAQQAAQGRTGDGGALPAQRVPGDGPGQQRRWHQHRRQGRRGRVVERARPAEHDGQANDQPERRRARDGHGRQGADADDLDHDTDDHDGAPVMPVGRVARDKREHEQRQELRQPDKAQLECGLPDARSTVPGQFIDLPGDGHALRLGPQDVQEPGDPEQHEAALAEQGGKAFGLSRLGNGGFGH